MNTLDKMIQDILNYRGKDVLEGMQNVADRFNARDFDGIAEDCNDVVRDIQDVFACDYFAASKFFAAEMRARYSINVE